MKKLFIFAIAMLPLMLAATSVTVYNNNFALVRTQLKMQLTQGQQHFLWDDVPTTIEPSSLIFKPGSSDVKLLAQNYEYDLADRWSVLAKYIGKNVGVTTKKGNLISGKLIFATYSLGLQDETTGKLTIVNDSEVETISLQQLPDNFVLKPSLNWRLYSNKKRTLDADISYICNGLNWHAVYNGVYDGNELYLNAWVDITNETGKDFADVNLKLMAGDVNKIVAPRAGGAYGARFSKMNTIAMEDVDMAFEEKAFADYHLYTLSDQVTFKNRQQKQLQLFEPRTVEAKKEYRYYTGSQQVNTVITFTNNKKSGLGLPLPAGTVKLYQKDNNDDQLEFIGESTIKDTPVKRPVELTSGTAFDITGETVVDSQSDRKGGYQRDYTVKLNNAKDEDVTVKVVHKTQAAARIWDTSTDFTKKSAGEYEFTIKVKAGKSTQLTFKQEYIN